MSVLQRFQPTGLGWLPCCGDPQPESQTRGWNGFKSWVDIIYLHLCSLYYYIFSAFVPWKYSSLERDTNTRYSTKVAIALLRKRCGYLLLTFLFFSLSSVRYIKSTEGLVGAFRKLRTSGTAAHGGTLPAGRPSTAIFLGTACQSTPQCPTIPQETNGLKQQQLQTAWILFFLVFLLLLFEKIICIPPPSTPVILGTFLVFVSSSLQKICAVSPCHLRSTARPYQKVFRLR